MDSLVKVNVGSGPNDGTGDPLRDAFIKVNKNVDTVVAAIGAPSGIAALGTDGRLPAGQAPAVQTLPTTAHDLNTYQTPGSYRQASTAGAQAGTNYPQATGGLLEVVGTGASGQALQRYTVASTGSVSPTSGTRQYWRVSINTSWSPWQEVHTAGNSLPYLGRVEAGADLNNYANRGMWAIAASSTAAGGTNFPIANSGWLLVYCEAAAGAAAGTNVNQVYIGSNGNRQFFRSLVGGAWSAWDEVVRSSLVGAVNGVGSLDASGRQPVGQAPYSAILPAGTDANTLATPGVWHINSDAQATAALNWPVVLAGTLNVEAVQSGNLQVTQVYTTRNGTGGVVRRFVRVRFGTSSTWGSWQEIAVFDAATGRLAASRLPAVTESLWNGTTLNLVKVGGVSLIVGNFDGAQTTDTTSFKVADGRPGGGSTYVPAVPGTGGNSAYFIARNADSPNSGFAALGVDAGNARALLTFSRHGTGAAPTSFQIHSSVMECGRITSNANWNIGVYGAPENESRMYVRYTGGGTQHGILFRPTLFENTVVLNFLQANGVGSGSITMTTAGTTFYNTSSDYRLKEATADVDVYGALDRVLRAHLREFVWKMDGSADRGAFAHELAEIWPKAVTGEKDALTHDGSIQPQGVDWSKLVPDLLGAVQAQQKIIEEMRAEIKFMKEAASAAGGSGDPAN